MNTMMNRKNEIVEMFSGAKNWEDRYRKIIQLGKSLPELDVAYKTEEHKVKGCQSQVWMIARLNESGEVVFQADSDAMIVRGLIALLLKFYSNLPAQIIVEAPPDFITELGLDGNLSPSRTNGLHSMVKQMKYYGVAFQALTRL